MCRVRYLEIDGSFWPVSTFRLLATVARFNKLAENLRNRHLLHGRRRTGLGKCCGDNTWWRLNCN